MALSRVHHKPADSLIVSAEEFGRLAGRARQPASLVRFFAESPLTTAGLDLERILDYGRDVEL